MPWRVLSAKVREQPHFVLGPKNPCHGRGPCGAKRGVRLRQGYGETSPKLEERRRARSRPPASALYASLIRFTSS